MRDDHRIHHTLLCRDFGATGLTWIRVLHAQARVAASRIAVQALHEIGGEVRNRRVPRDDIGDITQSGRRRSLIVTPVARFLSGAASIATSSTLRGSTLNASPFRSHVAAIVIRTVSPLFAKSNTLSITSAATLTSYGRPSTFTRAANWRPTSRRPAR